MNSSILWFTDGTTFFVGLALAVVGLTARLRYAKGVISLPLTIATLTGAILVTISSTPLALWMYIVWGVLLLAGLTLTGTNRRSRAVSMGRASTVVAFVLISAWAFAAELPYHLHPTIPVKPDQTVYVVGDSISAGMGGKERTWPAALAEKAHLQVINLARAGATVEDALKQSKAVSDKNSVVIVEIGGNDLLGGTDSATFASGLDKLLVELGGRCQQVVMFEIPLTPFCNAFGRAQRALARQHAVILIPKRYMTRVFGGTNGTLDGLHLSQAGHACLAEEVQSMFDVNP